MAFDKNTLQHSMILACILVLCLCSLEWITSKKHRSGFDILHPSPASPVVKKGVLFVRVPGKIGNHIWAYISVYGVARRTGRVPVVCSRYNLSKFFTNLSIPYNRCKIGREFFEEAEIVKGRGLLEKVKNSSSPYIQLPNNMRSLKIISPYMEEVLAELKIRESFKIIAQEFLHIITFDMTQKLNTKSSRNERGQLLVNGSLSIYIAVHVRRGDKLKHFTPPGAEYFIHAMNYMRNKHGKGIIFIVLSDDFPWCKANLRGEDVYFTGEHGMKSAEEDFSIGLACNHTVMSIGTYGFWISFLVGGDNVYYRQKKRIPSIYSKHWIGMNRSGALLRKS